MKKIVCILIILAFIFSYTTVVCAYDTVDVYVNGEELKTDQPAIIYQDRTLVPLRAICEALKCNVDWNGETQTITIKNELTIVSVQIGNYYLSMKDRREDRGDGDVQTKPIDVPPMIMGDRTLVPARAIAEALNAYVSWNAANRRVDITMEYDAISWFFNGFAQVTKDGKCGFIDKTGNVVVPLEYEDARQFDDDRVVVKKNGKWGCINNLGEVVLPIICDYTFLTADGRVKIGLGGKYGLFDFNENSFVVPIEFEDVYIRTECSPSSWEIIGVKLNGKYGFIDMEGNTIIDFQYDSIQSFDPDGIAIVAKNGKYGVINVYGEEILPFDYLDLAYFSAENIFAENSYGKWGILDENFILKVPYEYDDTSSLIKVCANIKKGLADYEILFRWVDYKIAVKKDGKCGIIDINNNVIVPFEYDDILYCDDDYIHVSKNGKWGYVNKEGDIVTPFESVNAEIEATDAAAESVEGIWTEAVECEPDECVEDEAAWEIPDAECAEEWTDAVAE